MSPLIVTPGPPDILTARYWVSDTVTSPAQLSIPYGAIWKYLDHGALSGGAAYADPAYDDSAWPTGPDPFYTATGYGGSMTSGTVVAFTPSGMDVWTRLWAVSTGGDVTLEFSWLDNTVDLYVDGVLAYSQYSPSAPPIPFTFPLAAGLHLFAVHRTDDGAFGGRIGLKLTE